jgi:signal transduction histidine kinase
MTTRWTSRLPYVAAVAWVLVTVSLASWWLALGLSMTTRFHRMFIWEGAAFIALLVAGGAVIVLAIQREQRRRRALDTFFMSFTHDLKTSLTSLQLHAESLGEDWPSGVDRRTLDRLLADTIRLQIQLENSLFVAQPDGRLLQERVDARRAIERLAQDWPTLSIRVTGDAALRVDARAFDAVLRNVLQNAVVHGGAREVVVGVAPAPSGGFRLTIADDGRGVPADALIRLGQPFARTGDPRGSGVGLFVCRQLVSRMHGALEFAGATSAPGGLVVTLDLPGAA